MADPLRVSAFSHVTIRVSDMDRSIPFYRDVLGLEQVFDVNLSGGGLDEVTGGSDMAGRMVGFLVPGNGVMIELICFANRELRRDDAGSRLGYGNLSLGVDDLDAAYQTFLDLGVTPDQKPVEVGGVRMFFVADPDGTRIEIIGFPGDGVVTSAGFHGRS
ncbi:MAG: VOC family protein [Myxococcota bacterium]|nr:VOC family protein [Myxococcota bacterium]